jgi:hypothetical protein
MWFSKLRQTMQMRAIVGAVLFSPALIPYSAQLGFSARTDAPQFAYSIAEPQFVDGGKVAGRVLLAGSTKPPREKGDGK